MRKNTRFSVLLFCTIILEILLTLPNSAQAQHRVALKTGWMFMIKPDVHYMFDAQVVDRYKFAGPFSLEFGGGFAINTNFMTGDFLIGGVLDFPVNRWNLSFRAAFIPKWLQGFSDKNAQKGSPEPPLNENGANFALVATFGPGFSYKFKNGRSIGFDLAFELGKIMTKTERFYFGVVPGLIFVF